MILLTPGDTNEVLSCGLVHLYVPVADVVLVPGEERRGGEGGGMEEEEVSFYYARSINSDGPPPILRLNKERLTSHSP